MMTDAVEVCPECDIAGCRHIRERETQRTFSAALRGGSLTGAPDAIDALRAEIDILTKSGIAEVAARNPSVMDYMRHWEGRAEKAEATLTALRAQVETLREALGFLDAEIASHGFVSDGRMRSIISRALSAVSRDDTSEVSDV